MVVCHGDLGPEDDFIGKVRLDIWTAHELDRSGADRSVLTRDDLVAVRERIDQMIADMVAPMGLEDDT